MAAGVIPEELPLITQLQVERGIREIKPRCHSYLKPVGPGMRAGRACGEASHVLHVVPGHQRKRTRLEAGIYVPVLWHELMGPGCAELRRELTRLGISAEGRKAPDPTDH